MASQRRHIAKVATEGIASGELNTDRFVMLEVHQSPEGHQGLADVRELGGVDVLSTAVGKVCQEGGGAPAFLRTNVSACLKLQNVSGNSA